MVETFDYLMQLCSTHLSLLLAVYTWVLEVASHFDIAGDEEQNCLRSGG